MKNRYNLWLVTARDARTKPVVEHMLDKHFPNCFNGSHFVWTHTLDGFIGKQKRDFILDFPGDKVAFIDDSPSEIERTQDIIPSYLLDSHGLHEDKTHIEKRVLCWREIATELL
jgi:hypothetical protein